MRLNHILNHIEQQYALSEIISNSYDNFSKGVLNNVTNVRVNTRISTLKDDWESFSIEHKAITIAIGELNSEEKLEIQAHSYFTSKLYISTHESYVESIEKLNNLLDQDPGSAPSTSSFQNASINSSSVPVFFHHARLPRIDLPKFNGTPSEWLPFKDLFKSLVIENPSLSAVEKLQYLKTSLTGSASSLLKNTTLSADNFQKSWEALNSFYENKRLLVSAALHSLLSLKRMVKESAADLEKLYTSVTQIYRTFESLQRPVYYWDDFLIFIVLQRLDSESVKTWEQHLGSSKELPTWTQFNEFLVSRLLSLKAFEKSHSSKSDPQPRQSSAKSHFSGKSSDNSSAVSRSCPICSEKHYVLYCPQYSNKTVQQRLTLVKKHKLCFNCLGNHKLSVCRVTKRCQKCAAKHHTSIHQIQTKEAKSKSTTGEFDTALNQTASKVCHSSIETSTNPSGVLLATAYIKIVNQNGDFSNARALIDQGSEISLITERLAQRLKLNRTHSNIPLVGIGAKKFTKTRGHTRFTITPHYKSCFKCTVSAHILPRLTTSIPSVSFNPRTWTHLNDLKLADPEYHRSGPIDLILGADIYGRIIEKGVVKGPNDSPIAQLTQLGWIISGPVNMKTTPSIIQALHVSHDVDLYNLLRNFWTLEEFSTDKKSSLSAEEEECEKHFMETHTRDEQGRYIVELPLKKDVNLLGDSYTQASKMVTRLFYQFNRNPEYAHAYTDFIMEYEKLKHMQLLPSNQPSAAYACYLPHHGVWRHQSLTTKLRVVFNGSSSTTSGYSLNDILHTGSKLQNDLFDVLIWFRIFRYVFSTDVEKMFRQIKVNSKHWPLQRILWKHQDETIVTYELTTVTYGLACAPYLSLRVFLQLLEDEGSNYPLAVPALKKGRYVDDIFGGADTAEQTKEIVKQLTKLCMAGGFNLQKWVTNHPSVLDFIPTEKRINTISSNIDDEVVIHTLGLSWKPNTDAFKFTVELPIPATITKRVILSNIAKIFNPLGFLSPITITAKIMMQELWTLKLSWDDPLPETTKKHWLDFVDSLKDIHLLVFPRWVRYESGYHTEVHGFCDASNKAFAAAVYLRVINEKGKVHVTFLASKTKVAPLKKLTIPRLELAGASLLTKLVSHLLSILNLDQTSIYLWTDSSITLTWITNHPSRWKEFVHNRVVFIQETLPQANWRFVPGIENPADLATRGKTPAQLSACTTWWNGPLWLSEPSSQWPIIIPKENDKKFPEERPVKVNVLRPSTEFWDLLFKYSNLMKLIRITALCQRAKLLLKKVPDVPKTKSLSTNELEDARFFWIKIIQRSYFHQEIEVLSKGKNLSSNNQLLRLTPFIDSNGLLRVGGRLQHSLLNSSAQHPLILPKESILTNLIIANAHEKTLHANTQLTLFYIRNDYWIIGGRTPVKNFIHKCIKCTRHRQQRAKQLMGQLPSERVTPTRPFTHTGIDYAGPFSVKTWKGKNAKTYKSYIALFVCYTSSALHLELVTDYTADAFIAAYKRFSARRGICKTLNSDCGTNLKGADAKLQALFSQSSQESEKIAKLLANDGTQWRFNPPAAPHFGGKWEAGVKSVKFHLNRVVGDTLLTYEEFNTLLTQIEAILNSRPLTPLTEDPEDLSALTPGHFLMGSPPTVIPEPTLENLRSSHLSRWQLLRKMMESFWTRWSKECLQRYLAIYKWNKPVPSLAIGALVLIVDERYPPSKWPLGRIVQTHPGKDGLTRVVTVRTQVSLLKRPVTKICPLPVISETL